MHATSASAPAPQPIPLRSPCSPELGLVLSGAADGALLLHSLSSGAFVRVLGLPHGVLPALVCIIPQLGALLVHSHVDLALHLYSVNCRHLASAGAPRYTVPVCQRALEPVSNESQLQRPHKPCSSPSHPLPTQTRTSAWRRCCPPLTAACCCARAPAAASRCAGCTPWRWSCATMWGAAPSPPWQSPPRAASWRARPRAAWPFLRPTPAAPSPAASTWPADQL